MKVNTIIDIREETPRTWEDALSQFCSLRKAKGISPNTIKGYQENVRRFFRAYPAAWSSKCRSCLLEHLSQEGISPFTYNMRLKTLRPFFAFCVESGVFQRSPIEGLSYRRAEPRQVDHSIETIKGILSAMDRSTFTGLRDYTLFLLQLDSGIRPSEALQLRALDIDTALGRAVIRASTSKTRRGRTVYYMEETSANLQKLVASRPQGWNKEIPVFCTCYGNPWNTHGWTTQLRRYATKAGIDRFSAYDLRHCHAILYLRNGGDVFTLQREMGHSTLSMTEKYLALSDQDVREKHAQSSPINTICPPPQKRAGKP